MAASQLNRSGSDGVAPETRSITPAPSTSAADTIGAASRAAGLRSRKMLMPIHGKFRRRNHSGLQGGCGALVWVGIDADD